MTLLNDPSMHIVYLKAVPTEKKLVPFFIADGHIAKLFTQLIVKNTLQHKVLILMRLLG